MFRNTNSNSVKSQWKNWVADKNSSPKYFKNYTNVVPPLFIFISYLINNKVVSVDKLNNLMLNKLKDNIKYIEHLMVEEFEYSNYKYKLRGII